MEIDSPYRRLQKILAECSLDNRIYILGIMDENSVSVAHIRQELIKAGVNKSFATVRRYLDSLQKIGLIEEDNGRFRLTNLGFYISSFFNLGRENIEAIETSPSLKDASISCLPFEFIHNIKVLKKAKYVADSFSLITELFSHIQKAEREICLLAPKPSFPLFELIGGKVLEGVVYRGIIGAEFTEERRRFAEDFIENRGLEGEKLKLFRNNFQMREHAGEVLIHAVVVDSTIAGMNFPYRDGRPNMETAFVSSDAEFVGWVRGIIDHFWERSKPIVY